MRNTQQIVERKVVVAGQIEKLEAELETAKECETLTICKAFTIKIGLKSAQDELEALDTEYAEAEARESVAAGDTVSVKLWRGETAREVPAEVLGVHTDATGKKTVAVVAEDAVVLVGIGSLVF